jgi:formylglycine-generating enzyme required for sulfatase activity
MKLFISYRSLDSAKVDMIVSRLASLKNEDKTPRYTPWQDKTGIPAGKDWWEAIVDAIIDCDVFVFHISQDALKSDVCRAELSYARKRNRPIIPVVLENEFYFNEKTGKNEITYWSDIPAELNDLRAQFLFYEGTSFFNKFDQAIAEFAREPQKWRDILASRPSDPREGSETTHDGITLYDEACDYAGRLEFTTAEKLFQKLVNRNDPDFGSAAFEWIELLRHYEKLLALDSKSSTRFRVRPAWDEYKKLFPKDFLDSLFDPKGFEAQFDQPAAIQPQRSQYYSQSADYLPMPFEWIEIPEGTVSLVEGGYVPEGGQTFAVPAFTIAKYPITNAQFSKFIKDKGYSDPRWWRPEGWSWRELEHWDGPLYWFDSRFNNKEQPVVGISWYEADAFCSWLVEETGELISLPNEIEWQRAAQGDRKLTYPWGVEWDRNRCNNSTGSPFAWIKGRPSPVRKFEGLNNSPYGVVDMVGNVWEFCSTDYDSGDNLFPPSEECVVRGGCYINTDVELFQTTYRGRYEPHQRESYAGFRIHRSFR